MEKEIKKIQQEQEAENKCQTTVIQLLENPRTIEKYLTGQNKFFLSPWNGVFNQCHTNRGVFTIPQGRWEGLQYVTDRFFVYVRDD